MKNNLEKIKGMLKGAQTFQVSPELDHKILRAIGMSEVSPHMELGSEDSPLLFNFNWLTQLFMKSIKQYAVAVAAIVLAFGGVWYYTQNSYSYHLEKAKVALVELKDVLAGKPAQTAFIPSAYAEEALPAVNEAVVTQLAATVVQETEKAIDIAETKTDPAVVQQALAEISVVQNQTVPVLADATVAVTTAAATQKISIALQITTTDQSILKKAQDFVAAATLNGDTQVAIDIQTSSDDERDGKDEEKKDEEKTDGQKAIDAKANLEAAKALVEELKTAKVDQENIDKILEKITKAEEALTAGDMGRAYGLSTAALAQGKHLLKEAKEDEKEPKKEEKKDGDRKDEEKSKDGDRKDEDKKDEEVKKEEDKRDGEGSKEEDGKDGDKKVDEKSAPALPLVPRLDKGERDSEKSSGNRDEGKSEREDD